MNYFAIKDFTKMFKNNTGVRSVSFSFERGNIVGFIGKNGSGKTTTIRGILGDFNDTKNSVFINEVPIDKKTMQKIAFFPDQNNFPAHMNIIEYANYIATLSNIQQKDYKVLMDSLIDQLQLGAHTKNKFSELSAGLQKKALLVSVLITNPELIILDEPTANLDVQSRISFLKTIQNLSIKNNISILITSHIIDELRDIVNKVVIIDEGTIIHEGNYDYKKDKDLKELYLELTKQKIEILDIELLGVKND